MLVLIQSGPRLSRFCFSQSSPVQILIFLVLVRFQIFYFVPTLVRVWTKWFRSLYPWSVACPESCPRQIKYQNVLVPDKSASSRPGHSKSTSRPHLSLVKISIQTILNYQTVSFTHQTFSNAQDKNQSLILSWTVSMQKLKLNVVAISKR